MEMTTALATSWQTHALSVGSGSPRAAERPPVRVCFVIDRLDRAGTESQLIALIRSLDRTRVIPSLVLLDGDDALSGELAPPDTPILRLGIKKLLSGRAIRSAWRLRRFWKAQRVEIVQTYFADSTYFAVPLARLCGMRRIVRVRNNLGYWLTPLHRRLMRLAGAIAGETLTNSEAGRDALLRIEGGSRNRIRVLGNGIDADRFGDRPVPFAGGGVRIGLVGNLRAVKNIDGLIRAFAGVVERFPEAELHVAGDGEERANLERLIGVLSLGDRVHLCGSLSDIPAFLGRLDIAVLCSHSESMSNALLEYMATARPIVVTDTGAAREMIAHDREGLVVPTGDDTALREALLTLAGDRNRAVAMGANARMRVEREFGRAAMCRRFEDYYRG